MDEELGQVTLRHPTSTLLLRVLALVVLGIGGPAWVELTVPGLVVPSLLLTGGTALWLAQALTAVAVLDDHGVTLSASRRGRRRLAWSAVAGLTSDGARLEVSTTDGRRLHGPPAGEQDVLALLDGAARLALLPRGDSDGPVAQ